MFVLKYIQKCCQTAGQLVIGGPVEVVTIEGPNVLAVEDPTTVIAVNSGLEVVTANAVEVTAEDSVNVE